MENCFRGRHNIKIDPKGRLAIPSSLRLEESSLKQWVFAPNSFKGVYFLDLYPIDQWLVIEKAVSKLPSFNKEVQLFKRFYLSGGQMVEQDSQGRLLVPKSLRKQAKLDKEILLVGMGQKFEVWNEGQYGLQEQDFVPQLEDSIQNLSELMDSQNICINL